MGITFYEMYSRSYPYKGEDYRETLRKICDRRVNKRPPIPATCPPKMASLMKKCWSHDPVQRPTAKELDATVLDFTIQDAEPLTRADENVPRRERPTGDMIYELVRDTCVLLLSFCTDSS